MRKYSLGLIIGLVALWGMACGSNSSPTPLDTNQGGDLIVPDGGGEDAYELPEAQVGKVFQFVDEHGDDGKPCKGTSTCNLNMSYNGVRGLKVQYLENGKGVASKEIDYTIVSDETKKAKLDAAMAYTDANGIAVDQIHVENIIGKIQVKACVHDEKDVPCLTFNISVSPKGVVPLTVAFKWSDYNGPYKAQLSKAKFYIFKQTASGEPKCQDLNIKQLPSATLISPEVLISQSAKFTQLPDLEKDKTQKYTIVGAAMTNGGVTKAWGCNDADGVVNWGQSTSVLLDLNDLHPSLVGSYEVFSDFDLVSGLPGKVKEVVETITNFFTSPSGEIMILICKLGDNNDKMKDFCGYLFEDPDNPDLDQLTGTGKTVSTVLDAVLISLLEKYCPDKNHPETCKNVMILGGDISEMLKHFQIEMTMNVKAEPDKDGNMPADSITEDWHTVYFRWRFGMNCDPADPDCGKRSFDLSAVTGVEGAVNASYAGTMHWAKTAQDKDALEIPMHPVNIKYGALVDFALEKIVLPQVFGNGDDGLPAVDSWEALLGSLFGGKECLSSNNCCEVFAQDKLSDQSDLVKNLAKSACTAFLNAAPNYIRNMLTGLDATTGNMQIGTKEPVPLYDTNNDMKFDAIGKKDKPGDWNAQFNIGGTTYSPKATFYGTRN